MTAPALTKRIWWILFRNEWFKARKRLAFLLPLGFYLFVTFINHFGPAWQARDDPDRSYTLPEAWSRVFGEDQSMMLLLFAGVCLVMLVSSEFTWRTARQNVIDGLSKTQWLVGKAMLVPFLGLVFLSLAMTIGFVISFLGTDLAAASGPIISVGVFKAAGGMLLAFLSVGGLALFVSLSVRGAGGAIATWFLWIFLIEGVIVPQLLGRIDWLRDYLQYQPFTVAQRLFGLENYDPAAFQRLVEAREAAERPAPVLADLTGVLWINAGWAALFFLGAFVIFRRRDL